LISDATRLSKSGGGVTWTDVARHAVSVEASDEEEGGRRRRVLQWW
jgi:hypothetical protein